MEVSTRLPGYELALSGRESFDVLVNEGPITAFGFDFVEPRRDPNVNASFFESTFSVTLKHGNSIIGSFNFAKPNDSAQFVGVSTDRLNEFDRIQIREIIGNEENEFFGQFYTGTLMPVEVVPVPGASWFFALALMPLIRFSRFVESA